MNRFSRLSVDITHPFKRLIFLQEEGIFEVIKKWITYPSPISHDSSLHSIMRIKHQFSLVFDSIDYNGILRIFKGNL